MSTRPDTVADTYLWLLPEDAVDHFTERVGGERLLTLDEQETMRHTRIPAARRRYLGAHLLCRYALSARTGLPMSAWSFSEGQYGRPEPEPASADVRFNISHTEGLIACVVTHGRPCGVDVESAPARDDAMTPAPRQIDEGERAALAASPQSPPPARIVEYWVLKEAYLKALGVGKHRELHGFAFSDPAAGPITVHDPEEPETSARWTFDLLHPGPGHVLAVATRDARPGAQLHRMTLRG